MTILLMLTGKFVFEYLGWGTAALATPAVMLVAGAAFFGLSLAALSLGASSSAALLTAGAIAGAVTQVHMLGFLATRTRWFCLAAAFLSIPSCRHTQHATVFSWSCRVIAVTQGARVHRCHS